MNRKLRPVLAAVIGLSLTLPGISFADHYGHGHKYKHGHKKHHRHHHRGHGGRGYQNNYYYKNNSNEKLLIGLLVGGITGYVISNAQHRNTHTYPSQYPPPQPTAVYPASTGHYSSSTCLQEREYQTTVVVGGKNVPAYGTACLQPDGSWQQGPAQPAAY